MMNGKEKYLISLSVYPFMFNSKFFLVFFFQSEIEKRLHVIWNDLITAYILFTKLTVNELDEEKLALLIHYL